MRARIDEGEAASVLHLDRDRLFLHDDYHGVLGCYLGVAVAAADWNVSLEGNTP